MRVMVTNDDGWRSEGIAALARALVDDGHDVVVVAPMADRSGTGASIGPVHIDRAITYERVSLPGVDVPAYAVDGPPALAVMAARLGGFGEPPQLVASGINPGANTGRATLHSGTVGAALTAANFGVSAVALSMETGDPLWWETAASVGARAVRWLTTAPRATVLNVNVPNRPLAEVAGVRLARLAPFGTVRAALAEGSGEGKLEIEMRSTEDALVAGTDTALLSEGIVAVTPLVGIRAAADAGGGDLERLLAGDAPAVDS